jgi:hypothetical protein
VAFHARRLELKRAANERRQASSDALGAGLAQRFVLDEAIVAPLELLIHPLHRDAFALGHESGRLAAS